MFSSDLPLHLGAGVACAPFCGCHCRLPLLFFLAKGKMPFIIIIIIIIICDITLNFCCTEFILVNFGSKRFLRQILHYPNMFSLPMIYKLNTIVGKHARRCDQPEWRTKPSKYPFGFGFYVQHPHLAFCLFIFIFLLGPASLALFIRHKQYIKTNEQCLE